jgi:cytochrome c-type biogenesis protein
MFGFDIFTSNLAVSAIISLIAGILSFLSPCVLPIVPPYIAYMSGISMSRLSAGKYRKIETLFPAFMFIIGLSTVFLIMGLAVSAFGSFFLSNQLILSRISGLLIIIISLHFLGLFRIPFLGPQLGAILALAATGNSIIEGTFLLTLYALGLGIPFILSALFISKSMILLTKLKKHMVLIEKMMGGLLLLVGILLVTGDFSKISFFLLEKIPFLAFIG